MVAQLSPERSFRGPGCSDACEVVSASVPGRFGRSELMLHDAASHEEYGRAVAAQALAGQPGILRTGPLAIDLRSSIVTLEGRRVDLSGIELKVLLALARHPGAVVETLAIIQAVWGDSYLVLDSKGLRNLLLTNVWRVRKRLRPHQGLVGTVFGVGYRLEMLPVGCPGPALPECRPTGYQPITRWSKRWDRCQRCDRDDRPHEARGLCRTCYYRWQSSWRPDELDVAP